MKTNMHTGSLSGRRCVIAGSAPDAGNGSAPSAKHAACLVEAALLEAVEKAGGEPSYLTMDEATDTGRLAGCDTLFLCGGAMSLRKKDAEEVWRVNVATTRHICKAAEEAHVRRIVLLGSILSLGHSADNSAIDATTPYLPDDKRTVFEKSLFRQEMEVWQMRDRGIGVSVVCGGIPITPGKAEGSNDGEGGRGQWAQRLAPVTYAHFLSTPRSLSDALVEAASDENEGRRLICTGLSRELAQKAQMARGGNARQTALPLLGDILGLSQAAKARKMLKRAGEYASDFAPANE